MRKNVRTSRRSYNNKNNNRYYDRTDYISRRNFDNNEKRRSVRQLREKDEQINFFAFKSVICSFFIFALIVVINTDFGNSIDVKDEIRTALSENMAFENIIVKVEEVFNKNKNSEDSENSKSPDSEEYQDFRIDENIIEQMNKESENIN